MATSLAQRAAALPPDELDAWLATLTPADTTALLHDWTFWARPEQLPPDTWDLTWLILAGRGFGKTRTGAETAANWMRTMPGSRGALIAPTFAAGRDVMFEGESGLLGRFNQHEFWRGDIEHAWNPSRGFLRLANGSTAQLYTSERPRRLRGPQHHWAWGDEPAEWTDSAAGTSSDTTWSNLLFGLRLGDHPRVILTGTPKPVALIRELVRDPSTTTTRGSTYDNLQNLSPMFRRTVVDRYEGTRLGRQELFAELIDDVDGALWTYDTIHANRRTDRPELARIVVAVDPATTSTGDETGIVVVGLGYDGHLYVLDDRTTRGTPDAWARRAIQAWLDYGADVIVAETNQGGDMVTSTIRTAATAMAAEGNPTRTVPTRTVHASRGKRTRAEPVSALYEQGRVHHIGTHPELEDQMTTWTPESGASPDRLDALVWAVTDLALTPAAATFEEW